MTPATLRNVRHMLRLTQAQLAQAIGRSRDRIARYEAGRSEIPQVVELAIRGLLAKEMEEKVR